MGDKEEYTKSKKVCNRIVAQEKNKVWKDYAEKFTLDVEGNNMLYTMMKNKRQLEETSSAMETTD